MNRTLSSFFFRCAAGIDRSVRPRRWLTCGAVVLATALAGFAHADEYPSRTVRILDGFTPGGGTDAVARYLATKLSAGGRVSVVVENRPGAAGQIAMGAVAKAQPGDGYLLMVAPNELVAVAPLLYKNLPYDVAKDFVVAAALAEVPLVLTAGPRLAARTLPEMLAQARQHPGQLNFGSAGLGTIHHLSSELLKSMAKVDMLHVPYKGTSAAVNDLLAGQIDFVISPITAVLPHIQANKLRALAVAGRQRTSALPDVPTLAEAGVPGYESRLWFMLLAPTGTPPAVLDKWQAMTGEVLLQDDARKFFGAQGVEMISLDRAEIRQRLAQDAERWRQVISEARISVE